MDSTLPVMDSTPPVMDSTPPVMNLCYVITGRVDKSTGNYAINRLSMKIRVMFFSFEHVKSKVKQQNIMLIQSTTTYSNLKR